MNLNTQACIAVALVLFAAAVPAREAPSFKVGPLQAQPGEIISGSLEVAPGPDAGSEIPVTLAHGARPGPVLALIAGTHGYEYPPITALQRVRANLDPRQLSGTVILVHIANLPSFLGRTIYYSPVDGKNLNRVYPGKRDGTLSERIAHTITTEVIERADYLVDLHGGDGNEALRPYVYMPLTGNAELDSATRGMALAFGLDHIVIDERPLSHPDRSVYTDHTALTRGIPAITTETGQLGSNDERWIRLAEDGVWNLLRHLGMLAGEPSAAHAVVWLMDYEIVRSPADGIFRATVEDGYAVAEGGLVGRLVNFFGDPVVDIRAPFAGVVNYVLGTPPVKEGEPLAMISRIKGREDPQPRSVQ